VYWFFRGTLHSFAVRLTTTSHPMHTVEDPVACPICAIPYPAANIDAHVNMCLDRQANSSSLSSPASNVAKEIKSSLSLKGQHDSKVRSSLRGLINSRYLFTAYQ
jgi:hypothetical protein